MLVDEGVHPARHPGHLDARRVLVDEEERRRTLLPGGGQHDHEVGVVADGDEPLLAVQHPAAVGPRRRCTDALRVGARLGLAHRVAVPAPAPDHGHEVALALLGRAEGQGVGRPPHHVPQRAGEPPELGLDGDLLQDGEAGAAPLHRHVDGLQPAVEDGVADLGVRPRGQAVVLLAVDLVLHDELGEFARRAPQFFLTGGETEVHVLSVLWVGVEVGLQGTAVVRRRAARGPAYPA